MAGSNAFILSTMGWIALISRLLGSPIIFPRNCIVIVSPRDHRYRWHCCGWFRENIGYEIASSYDRNFSENVIHYTIRGYAMRVRISWESTTIVGAWACPAQIPSSQGRGKPTPLRDSLRVGFFLLICYNSPYPLKSEVGKKK